MPEKNAAPFKIQRVLTSLLETDLSVGLTFEQQMRGVVQGITFAAVTFSQIVEALKAECADFERELLDIVEDYASYLSEEHLLEERNRWLVVFPCGCGTTLVENAHIGLYYEPPSRPCKRSYRFIAVYRQKTIAYVGTVEAIAVAVNRA